MSGIRSRTCRMFIKNLRNLGALRRINPLNPLRTKKNKKRRRKRRRKIPIFQPKNDHCRPVNPLIFKLSKVHPVSLSVSFLFYQNENELISYL